MNRNAIIYTLFTLCLLNFQLLKGQNVAQVGQTSRATIQSQLDETCNLATMSTNANSYIFMVKPVDVTPNCTHYINYFEYNPQTKTWDKLLNDTISTMPYIVQVGLSKDVAYRVQHYIVSNDNPSNPSNHSDKFEADFSVKRTVKAVDEEVLVLLAQKNINIISGSTSENNEIKNTKKY